jgi:hypothetical protein
MRHWRAASRAAANSRRPEAASTPLSTLISSRRGGDGNRRLRQPSDFDLLCHHDDGAPNAHTENDLNLEAAFLCCPRDTFLSNDWARGISTSSNRRALRAPAFQSIGSIDSDHPTFHYSRIGSDTVLTPATCQHTKSNSNAQKIDLLMQIKLSQ